MITGNKIMLPAELRDAEPLFKALGGGDVLRFVGGCVRNSVLVEPIGDIDLATKLTPPEVIKKLKAAGIKTVPTGIEHGTVTAVLNGQGYEITTLRRDVETDGRRATVAFTQAWEEDAARRDFTMNTLLSDLSGNIFDPLRTGLKHLKAGKVLFVGDPAERIAEDYLRVLRFFRFHATYGKGQPDRKALIACGNAARKMNTLSRERVTQELLKILQGRKPADALVLMQEYRLLSDIFVPGLKKEKLQKIFRKQKEIDVVALAARLSVISTPKKLKDRLRLPLRTLALVSDIQDAGKLFRKVSKQQILLSLYTYGREITEQALLIKGASPQYMKFAREEDIPVFKMKGRDLIKGGMKPGPEVGKKLRRIELAWIRSGFKDS
jgi:poly(A) polymerase